MAFLNRLFSIVLEGIRWFFILLFIIVLFGMIAPYISDIHSYPYVLYVLKIDASIIKMVHAYLPTRIFNHDMSHPIALIIILIMMNIFRSSLEQIRFVYQRRQMLKEISNLKSSSTTVENEKIALFENKLEQASSVLAKSRRELLNEFAKIKIELEKVGRDLAFLSMDVVDSSSMKQGEDKSIVEHDFLEYHNFVEEKFKENGMIKASWTPDGVMACFNQLDDAVNAAQSVINGLDYFNHNVKAIKKDFHIRCGINSGHVYYDDTIPLEQFSDRILDVAGHMQKNAPPDTILIAKQLIDPIQQKDTFKETEHLVDGIKVSEWKKQNP